MEQFVPHVYLVVDAGKRGQFLFGENHFLEGDGNGLDYLGC